MVAASTLHCTYINQVQIDLGVIATELRSYQSQLRLTLILLILSATINQIKYAINLAMTHTWGSSGLHDLQMHYNSNMEVV